MKQAIMTKNQKKIEMSQHIPYASCMDLLIYCFLLHFSVVSRVSSFLFVLV